MALDGSFDFRCSLERFLARCPKLQSSSQFDLLVGKGNDITEDDIVQSLAELFPHPSYTIPLIGCFLPISRRIVDKAVALLKLVPDLRSNSEETLAMDEAEGGVDDVFNMIDLYERRRRGLDLHELASLALCRALDMAPFLMSSVLNYFNFAPPPFQRILMEQSLLDKSMKDATLLLRAAQISYRFLLMEPEIFIRLWDWSCFISMLNQSASFDSVCRSEDLKVFVTDLRWCGVQILSVVLKISYRAAESLIGTNQDAFSSLLRWEEFCRDISLEKAGCYVESSRHRSDGQLDIHPDLFLKLLGSNSQVATSSLWRSDEHLTRPQKLASWYGNDMSFTSFVLTSTMKRSFERVSLAVSQKWPTLIYGPPGSGKSALIKKLSYSSGNRVLSIQMDDQIDGRTLVGGYVCTERPGEFRWQPGSLTQAVQNGYWVVFEDIDHAPSDVHSILLALLEGASTFITGHGEEVRVAENFRLFSTVATSHLDTLHNTGGGSLSVLWRRVMIGPPSTEDLQSIVEACYPQLKPLSPYLIETYVRINSASLYQNAGYSSINSASVNTVGRFSLRDLLKWCSRVACLDFGFTGGKISDNQRYCIYREAVDVFASFSASAKARLTLMKDIAKLWVVPVSVAETLYPRDKPIPQDSLTELRIGRVSLHHTQKHMEGRRKPFVELRVSLHVLEKISTSVKYNEPVLLVGETGTGKTTLVQNLALRLGQKLTVLNLSQQSDIADLLGGFKPVDAQFVYFPLYKEFEDLFAQTFSLKANASFLSQLQNYLTDKNWKKLLNGFRKGLEYFRKSAETERSGTGKKRKKPLDEEKVQAWDEFSLKLESAFAQQDVSSGMVFSFVEGSFVTALRNGEWILLDEVNLAPPETLQRIVGVLEGENGSLCLAERGDINCVQRHPNFRIFACMNPATDSGKRDLPLALRSRFTEYFVDDVLDDDDLSLFVSQFLRDVHVNQDLVNKIVRFYKTAKMESEERLQDGANQKPQFSLRSLYRALEYARIAQRKFGVQKALYDGFSMFFLTLLDEPSRKIMNEKILSHLFGGCPLPHVPFDHYLSSRSDAYVGNYILTKSVREHLGNLARVVLIKKYPVLLQGPTSSGKTSLVRYLAAITGHEFVRINNHEHTDLQEYLGSYVTDANGKLVFHEGVLVRAVRNGYWIVLDELNLAPSDVLEALNRLLDDNRELFVPELQITIRAHPDFMLFATQNPPLLYGGRKILSRAFRNRFVEVHVGEIPENELTTILESRCEIPESYAKKMVEVMKELQLHRQSSRVFAGKHGFITPRDLFRWANRFRKFGQSYEDLAKDGYYLLAERLRDEGEKLVVQEILERNLRVKLARDILYDKDSVERSRSTSLLGDSIVESIESFMLTKSMRRLYFLVDRCFQLREPVLLIGETGGGKTTVCQLLSYQLQSKLHILNCHQFTETSDFLGGFRPIRDRSSLASDYEKIIEMLKESRAFTHFQSGSSVSSDIDHALETIGQLRSMICEYRDGKVCRIDVTIEDVNTLEQIMSDLGKLYQKWQTIFEWQDGPLLKAMRDGDLLLVDEISLADDSVLERLNSVLEPERKLSLAEKGGSEMEEITAHPNFYVLATMNPGGDYGKKELSPALRNRFTEIWVPSMSDLDELRDIALQRISRSEPACSNPIYPEKVSLIIDAMLNFWEWFNHLHTGRLLTVRDLISWVEFLNVTGGCLGSENSCLHGVFLVLLDGISLGTGISKSEAEHIRKNCLLFLLDQLMVDEHSNLYSKLAKMEAYGWGDCTVSNRPDDNTQGDNVFGIHPFYIRKGSENSEVSGFEFLAPTTRRNALRVLRAMQLPKPVLLEGSPGVGKTSLIMALGKFSGHKVVRINLSEQTDMMDLLGSDLPVESNEGMKFAWSDGILLQALKEGCWVLLDELNLASQSVLEGLNAILDHRAEVFIPELGQTYKCPPSFRVFACQNPSHQGGGRKGLPKSFLNRFTKVYVDELGEDDYLFICKSLYPSIEQPLLSKLIIFNKKMHEETMLYRKFGQEGSPWEFNLRDVLRSCEIIQGAPENLKEFSFLNIVYIQRMRTAADRREVLRLYEEIFRVKSEINPYPRIQLNTEFLIAGNAAIRRNNIQASTSMTGSLKIMPGIRQSFESVAQCVERQWLCILIGPSSSGKTSLIRLLAELTGSTLNELNLSPATDISELLGSFEQYDAMRNLRLTVSRIECFVNKYCSSHLEPSGGEFILESEQLIARWMRFLSSKYLDNLENWNVMIESLDFLVEIIQQLKADLAKSSLSLPFLMTELDDDLKIISRMKEVHQKRLFSTKFEWVTGLLIRAIEQGEWIVFENANLCNPTVLDRINSLVETSGSITVNERGTVGGHPLVIHPHPNFRIFLTVNPKYGEVSRAMRNRGVEIFIMQPYWLQNEMSGDNYELFELKETKRFLILSGIPVSKLVDMMAKCHLYARNESAHYNFHVTFLELSRWVHLFQQLLMSGNQAIWSLQVSWEHTYLSALGDAAGGHIVKNAKTIYLSESSLLEYDPCMGSSLCLPGGWPLPLKLKDFVYYSKEITVKQNCLQLEFLGAQYGSYKSLEARRNCCMGRFSVDHLSVGPYLMDVRSLEQIMFHKVAEGDIFDCRSETKSDLEKLNEMLFYAANWTIQQATGSDLELYLIWFRWFNVQVQPFCLFFHYFLTSFEQVMDHPIWKYLINCHKEIAHILQLDSSSQPVVGLLSVDLVELAASDRLSASLGKFLYNAISCIGPLILSYQQWDLEDRYYCQEKRGALIQILKVLRKLEQRILQLIVDSSSMLIQSQSFDSVIFLYSNLLEDHKLYWHGVTSSKSEHKLVSWRCLMKTSVKLRDTCTDAIDSFLMECSSVDMLSSSEKSLLWSHGGHPNVPSSRELYLKQFQLLQLCELFWPTKRNSQNQGNVDDSPYKVVAYTNPELRLLAMEGIAMSSFIIAKCGHEDNDAQVGQSLDEMHQVLLCRFQLEKQKIRMHKGTCELVVDDYSSVCCSLTPEISHLNSVLSVWDVSVPPINKASLFWDIGFLSELMPFTLYPEELHKASDHVSNIINFSLNFSLHFSSRPPQMFTPHQKVLWLLGALDSVDSANVKIASFVLEIWFRWHQSLWVDSPDFVKSFRELKECCADMVLPDMLIQPVYAATVLNITQSPSAVKDFVLHRLKYRLASSNLWRSSHAGHLPSLLFSAARNLFLQIILAHKKSFDDDRFASLWSTVVSFEKNAVTEGSIQIVCDLLLSSRHSIFRGSVHGIIAPLIRALYQHYGIADINYHLGLAWLLMGKLRFHLLLTDDNLDPSMKYYCKYTNLVEKLSSLELETQVREECRYLSGQFSGRVDTKRLQYIDDLQATRKKLQRKIVYRLDPGKFKMLKGECVEFLKVTANLDIPVSGAVVLDLDRTVTQVSNWQETSNCFIERLTDAYIDYNDVIQPIQVAVYEMKLGLSLCILDLLRRAHLKMAGLEKIDMETIYWYMRFPEGASWKLLSVNCNNSLHKLSSYEVGISMASSLNLDLLEKLVHLSNGSASDVKGSSVELKASLYRNILQRTAYCIADAKIIDMESFSLLDKIFHEFASLWMKMRVDEMTRRDHDAQHYKFRARVFSIKRIIDVDISSLPSSKVATEIFSEWSQMLSEEETLEKEETSQQPVASDDEWNLVEESILNDVIKIHNQLFGFEDLVLPSGILQPTDADRLSSFSESYTLGNHLLKGVAAPDLSTIDMKLVPEHLLYLSLDFQKKFHLSQKSAARYNFYKDPNAPVMARMVKILASLEQHFSSFVSEWQDNHDAQKVLHIIDMLLNIPLCTPLAKALSGLQFFLQRVHDMLESGSKFLLSNQLDPVIALVTSWQKIELDSWPTLIDEVEAQCESNAQKLWFPLYSILQQMSSAGGDGYNDVDLQSLEDFFLTSSIGEFKRRLQLLLAFFGQISMNGCFHHDLSSNDVKILTALFNLFGYFIQFLPIVLDYKESSRKKVEAELKELLKLCHWQDADRYMSLDTSKNRRQKLRKLIQKYTDILLQPVALLLVRCVPQKATTNQFLSGHEITQDFLNKALLRYACDQALFSEDDRFSWFDASAKHLDDALQNLQLKDIPNLDTSLLYKKVSLEDGTMTKPASGSGPTVLPQLEAWKAVWHTVEDLYATAVHCGDIWKEANKNMGKRRALADLLKQLETIGLSKHRSTYGEDNVKSWWFLNPSIGVHLLLPESAGFSCGAFKVPALINSRNFSNDRLAPEWKTANKLYFWSVASIIHLYNSNLKPHNDITLEQVDRVGSFLNQLVLVQQSQLHTADGFAKQIKRLMECMSTVEKLSCLTVIKGSIPKQHATHSCMWQQKELFDSMSALSREELLLFRIYECSHTDSCLSVKSPAKKLVTSFEELLQLITKSKASLDSFLIGDAVTITPIGLVPYHFVVTSEMEMSVCQNFQTLKDIEERLHELRNQDHDRSSINEALLCRFDELIKKGKEIEEDYKSEVENQRPPKPTEVNNSFDSHLSELCLMFDEAVRSALEHRENIFRKPDSSQHLDEEFLPKFTTWEVIFKSFIESLDLNQLCDGLFKALNYAEKLFNCQDHDVHCLLDKVSSQLRHLHVFTDLVLNFSSHLLKNLLDLNKTVSSLTRLLADILASLYSTGFGTATENHVEDGAQDAPKDASGTGMGEGVGRNDVSDEITDEDQLLGTLEQANEKPDSSGDIPDKNNKGIEMEEDFEAAALNLSEDSDDVKDDNNDGDEEQIESAMGPTGGDDEVIDEKLWDKGKDETPNETNDEYESGPSVKDIDKSNREMRAKDDLATAGDPEESNDASSGGDSEQQDEIAEQDMDNGDGRDDMIMDKEPGDTDPTDLPFEEINNKSDNEMDLDERKEEDAMEEENTEEHDESAEGRIDEEEEAYRGDEDMEDESKKQTEQTNGTPEKDVSGERNEENTQMEHKEMRKDVSGSGNSELVNNEKINSESAGQYQGDQQPSDLQKMEPESNWSNAPGISNLPACNDSDMDFFGQESKNTGRFAEKSSNADLHQLETPFLNKSQPNPFRNVGNAFEEWKERANITGDLEAEEMEVGDKIEDKDAAEYGYVPDSDQGTAQALGPATLEQVDSKVDANRHDEGSLPREKNISEVPMEMQNSDPSVRNHASVMKRGEEQEINPPVLEQISDEAPVDCCNSTQGPGEFSDSLVSFGKQFSKEGIDKSQHTVSDDEMVKLRAPRDDYMEVADDASARWRRYELSTSKLSQELAEQLRLIMEPTVASKLQGDYRTGKRINMKKVIPYIASHYRKDKIWLRRTRPNKRDYQVIIAVDDSRSMSESGCGDVAIEALVTVCRAVSQLELGSLAVASFGTKGNVKLLHDFDKPFTGEAGSKMISNLTFKQDNTIRSDPMADLLKYINLMLEEAVSTARLASGHSPLQQLVLIIADGRFTEKERLKHHVRDLLSAKRMVAFLLLDSSKEESILDIQDVSIDGGNVKLTKYMDSFPFPFYVLLRNIEALPQTLANLLRQWFELMQSSAE